MLEVSHLRTLVIIPSLAVFPATMRTGAAVELLVGTALVESRCTYLKQGRNTPDDGLGVAVGLYQCEPATHADLWDNYLRHQPSLAQLVSTMGPLADSALITDLAYATRIARIHYWRSRRKLPEAENIQGLAAMWKAVYNTPRGKGKPEEFVALYRQFS